MINISEISLRFADKVIFDNVSIFIRDTERIGIVGDNGTGKTTFLRSLMNNVYLDKGTIEIKSGKSIAYLSQEATELPEITVLNYMRNSAKITELEAEIKSIEKQISVSDHESSEYIQLLKQYENILHEFEIKNGYSFDSEAKRILAGLGFKNDDHSRLCTEFSGGWKIRINLAVVLSKNADILLLDEPTNHLDAESMEWLESYLRDHQGAILTVSHDRRFLDKMVSKIIELKKGKLNIFSGNYSFYLKEKERRLEALKKEYEAQQGEIKRIQDFIDRFRSKASKAPQVQSRIKMLEKFDVIELENESKKIKIKFPDSTKSGNEVVKVKGLAKSYGDLKVFENINFTAYRGEKIAVVGKNGAGKSTLFKIVFGETEPTSGNVEFGLNVIPAYFSQESSENLNAERNIWEEIQSCGSAENDTKLRSMLGAFLFSGNDIYKPISVLSGGEKSRMALLKILLSKSNLLILDEPTNHLDTATKNLFQEALLNYEGTIIIVSHDRFFLDELANKVYEIKDGALKIIEGNYSYYIEKRAQAENQAVQIQTSEKDENKNAFKSKDQKRAEADRRNQLHKETKYFKEKLEKTEAEIEAYEVRKTEIESLLSGGLEHDYETTMSLSREIGNIEVQLAYKMDEWADLNEKLEEKLKAAE
ncbi:MAG TPA: ATP-binding cassette domain-containing protein [Clostridiales bacterium]|nr:ATP-binding cassette domain-containing protein [Clostridiales bacterium]HQP69268.1 ATP-binding cassette domain-containing protein [Clostridiales bacterium]